MTIEAYFRGRSAIITGGSSGIGLEMARQLLDAGADVCLVARRESVLDEAKAELTQRKPAGAVHTIALDVSDEDAVKSALGAYLESHPVDILINNAGVVMPGKFLDLPTKEFRQMMDINYFGAVYTCQAALPGMIKRATSTGRPSHVLNVSSLAGYIGIFGYTAYAASKFALRGFSEALRGEVMPHNVRISVCFPPDTDTPQLAFENQYKPAETKAIAGTVKPMSATEVAQATLRGMAKNRFEIIPGTAAWGSAIAQRLVPGIVRATCDSAQKRAT